MSERQFTTRAAAAAPSAHLIETLAIGFYASERAGTTLPPWDRIEPRYQTQIRKHLAAAVVAAEAAGYRVVKS